MTGYSPHEIIYGMSRFDPLKRNLLVDLEAIKTASDKSKAESLKHANKTRKFMEYQKGQKVYKHNELRTKLGSNWIGPFTIVSIGNNGTMEIENDTKVIKVNTRKVRPF